MRLARALAVLVPCIVLPARVHGEIGHFEELFGVTNINAIVGNGGLAAGFAQDGDLTVLKWPSPSFHEHLNYRTSSDQNARELPHFGADDNMGVFAGIIYRVDGSPAVTTSWLRGDTRTGARHTPGHRLRAASRPVLRGRLGGRAGCRP